VHTGPRVLLSDVQGWLSMKTVLFGCVKNSNRTQMVESVE